MVVREVVVLLCQERFELWDCVVSHITSMVRLLSYFCIVPRDWLSLTGTKSHFPFLLPRSSATTMSPPVLNAIGGIVAGVATAMFAFVVGEMLSAVLHPFPDGFQGTQEEIWAHVARYPDWALAACAPIWVIGAYGGTWIAQRLGGDIPAIIVAAVIVAGVLFNISQLPYPRWFPIVIVPTILLAVYFASFSQASEQLKRS